MCKNFYFDIFITKNKCFAKDESVALIDKTDTSDPKKYWMTNLGHLASDGLYLEDSV